MKVRVLGRAEDDLTDGFWFYENQQADLGRYFLDQLYMDTLPRWSGSAASIEWFSTGFIGDSPAVSLSQAITESKRIKTAFTRCSIVA